MSLLNWFKNLQNNKPQALERRKTLKNLEALEDLKEQIEKRVDELTDRVFHISGEYKINPDGSRSTIRPNKYYLIEAEKEVFLKWFNSIISGHELSEREIRLIKKLAASKFREMLKNEEELGLCSVDVLDVPDKTRRKVKHILDSKFDSRVDLDALKKTCTIAGLDYIGIAVSLETLKSLSDEFSGKALIAYQEGEVGHAIRFRGFDEDGNVRGISGNDDGAIRRILVHPSKILNEKGEIVLFLRREVRDKYFALKSSPKTPAHPSKIVSEKEEVVLFLPTALVDKYFKDARKLSDEELKNITIPKNPLGPIESLGPTPYEEVIEAFNKAIELNSKDPDVWERLWKRFEALNHYDEKTLKTIEKLIEVSEFTYSQHQKGIVWSGKANCLERLGRYEEAVEAYNRVIELKPDWDAPRHWRNELLKKLNQSSNNGS